MPHFKIETNVKSSDIKDIDGFTNELIAAVAETLGKPINYCVATIIPDVKMAMGGPDLAKTPCAQASLMSIGKLGLVENKKHAAKLFPIVNKHLGVADDRCYLTFIDAKSQDVGFKGSTFHDILG